MLRLRLFHRDDPTNQIDSRTLDEGEIAIGRDAKADWMVSDPDRAISRRHVVIAARGGFLTLRDTSSNGVFLGTQRTRVDRDRAVPIQRGETIQFGNYLLVVEDARGAAVPTPDPSSSPFGGEEDAPRPPRAQPFGSAIKPDPFGAAEPVADGDAWERRPDAPAGSWDAVAPHRKPDHAELIGSPRTWAKPPPPPAEEAGYGFDAPFARPILEPQKLSREAAAIPSDWMDAPAAGDASPPPFEPAPVPAAPAAAQALPEPQPVAPVAAGAGAGDDHLFQHFCAGAGLNPQAFAGENRAQVMERLGGVYRQAMLGVAELMRERTALRNEYRMVHTAVRPEGNNPFKWVPPQRIAVELLRDEDHGYTTGERALNDALHEIKAHLLCMLAGMRAALAATFQALSPEEVEARVAARSYLLPMQRDAALWHEYVQMAGQVRSEADDSADGLINRAFRQAYEAQAAELTGRR